MQIPKPILKITIKPYFLNQILYSHEFLSEKNLYAGNSCCGSLETNLTSIHEDAGLIPGLAQWVKDPALP